jgi:hypothetical protein
MLESVAFRTSRVVFMSEFVELQLFRFPHFLSFSEFILKKREQDLGFDHAHVVSPSEYVCVTKTRCKRHVVNSFRLWTHRYVDQRVDRLTRCFSV